MLGIAARDYRAKATGQLPDTAAMARQFEQMYRQWEGQSASIFPEYADLRCTPDGTLWLQPFDVTNGPLGRGPGWQRISRDGSRSLVTFPEEFTPMRFEADRIWGAVRDSLGATSAAWIRMDGVH